MFNWLRELIASDEQPLLEKYNVVDPSAVGEKVRAITLALTPSTLDSPTSVVSLYWTDSNTKAYEKQFGDTHVAQDLFNSMKSDLNEVAELTKMEKIPEASALMSTLLKRYDIHTDPLMNGHPEPITTTMASRKEADEQLPNPLSPEDQVDFDVENGIGEPLWMDKILEQLQHDYSVAKYIPDQDDIILDVLSIASDEAGGDYFSVKQVKDWLNDYHRWRMQNKHSALAKIAKIVFQNIFFSTPEEATAYQEQMKKLNPPTSDVNTTLPKIDENMGGEPGAEVPEGEEDISAPSLSYEDFEKNKADEQKMLTKRIEREVQDQVESALEKKVATKFSSNDEELVDAMRGVGRTWEEISDYMVKELKYKKEDVAMFLDQFRNSPNPLINPNAPKEEPKIEEPILEEPAPEAPKPPEELVSPETHDKLVDEVTEIPKKEMMEIAKLDEEISKKADGALETVPQTPIGTDNSDLGGADVSDQMLEEPNEPPAQADIEDPLDELTNSLKPNDHVYVLGDYDQNTEGFGGIYLSQYKSEGETYAVIEKDNKEVIEVPLRNVKKAFHTHILTKLSARKKEKASTELAAITAELSSIASEFTKISTEELELENSSQDSKRRMNLSLPVLNYGFLINDNGRLHFDDPADTRVRILEHQGNGALVIPENGKGKTYVSLSDIQIVPKEQYEKESSLKEAAPFDAPVPSAQPETPVAPEQQPVKFKPMDRAPDKTKDQEVVTPNPELGSMFREMNEVTAKIKEMDSAVKKFIAQIEAEKQQRLKEFETKVQPEVLKKQQEDLTQKIATVMKALENKAVEASEYVYRLQQETKVNPYKISDKEMLDKVKAKFEGVEAYIESVINGAKSKDTKTDEWTLYRSPKPKPRKSMKMLSRRDIEAGTLDTLSGMYEDLVAAFKLLLDIDTLIGNEATADLNTTKEVSY